MSAIGFIETMGLVAAVEAADAMLKAADVRLLEKNQVGSGLVTITVAGEVSAVKASVDAGVAAVERVNPACLVSQHVIPRPDAEVAKVIATAPEVVKASPAPMTPAPAAPVAEPQAKAETTEVEAAPAEKADLAPKVRPEEHNFSQLKKMKVGKLRSIARSLDGISLSREEIKFAKKKALIDAIVKVYR